MNLNEWVFWIGTAVLVYDAAVSWAHVVMYAAKSNWRMYDEGKALMGTMATFALVLTYVAISSLQYSVHLQMADYPQRGFVRIVIFVIVGLGVTRWLMLLLRNQRRARLEGTYER